MSQSEPRFSRSVWAVIGFTFLYTAVAVSWAFSQKNDEFKLYLAVLPVIVFLLGCLHLRLRFTTGLLWCLSLLGLLHMLGGLVVLSRGAPTEGKRLLYNLWLIEGVFKYDNLIHTLGSGITTWFLWQALRRMARGNWLWRDFRPKTELLFLCVLAGAGIGSVHEVMEFTATQMVNDANVGGYVNTLLDLIANIVGGLIAAALLWKLERSDAK